MESQDVSKIEFYQSMVLRLLEHQNRPGTPVSLSEADINTLCRDVRIIFMSQPMLLRLSVPSKSSLKFVGDIHGQYHDLLKIFQTVGFPPQENFLFLGDYVDRGRQSLEVICLLFAFKVLYPENVFILRGNHEVASINRTYGFYDECRRRYSVKLWKTFCDVFNCLPLAALVENRIFCMHGGIPNMNNHPHFKMEDIERIPRPLVKIADQVEEGIVEVVPIETDLLWADPTPNPRFLKLTEGQVDSQYGFTRNHSRGVSHFFGSDVLEKFLQDFDLDLVVRAHEVVEDGYVFFGSPTRSKMCLTLFGAPNYTGEQDNAAAVMSLNSNLEARLTVLAPPGRLQPLNQQGSRSDELNPRYASLLFQS